MRAGSAHTHTLVRAQTPPRESFSTGMPNWPRFLFVLLIHDASGTTCAFVRQKSTYLARRWAVEVWQFQHCEFNPVRLFKLGYSHTRVALLVELCWRDHDLFATMARVDRESQHVSNTSAYNFSCERNLQMHAIENNYKMKLNGLRFFLRTL